jgi:CRISPR-associated protein Csb2
MYVPNNSGDLMTAAWARGDTETSMARFRVEKDVRPTHLTDNAVHYLYPIAAVGPEFARHKEALVTAVRSITHLGWGVDMVAGNASVMSEQEAAKLTGERWRPSPTETATQLRVPRIGTLNALRDKHQAFLTRLSAGGFKPVPPLTAFDTVGYRRDTDLADRPVVAFELRTTDFERFQPYDTTRRTPGVAGMVRNAVADLARLTRPFGWTDQNINTFVHGHTADGTDRASGEGADSRFSYLPLPSLERRGPGAVHVGAIRRVLIAAPAEHRAAVTWARVLSGTVLAPLGDTLPAALRLLDRPAGGLRTDTNLGPYVGDGRVWSTVTPVVLHRHEPTASEIRGLFVAAFRHAGFSEEVANGVVLEWRNVGFRAGVDLATRFRLPLGMTGPRFHVRVTFPHPIRGPLAIGSGRYRGLGLFATEVS